MDTYFIYYLADNQGKPFYVGKTNLMERRYRDHIKNANNGLRRHVYCKIRKILSLGQSFTLVPIEETTRELANDREKFHIARVRSEGHELCNHTDGGEGWTDIETARKREKTRRLNGTNTPSEETKHKLSEALKGKPKSEAHKQALKTAWKRTPEQIAKISETKSKTPRKGLINTKKYIFISPDGVEIETTNGLTHFCEIYKLDRHYIYDVLRGDREHYKGWKVRYHQENKNE